MCIRLLFIVIKFLVFISTNFFLFGLELFFFRSVLSICLPVVSTLSILILHKLTLQLLLNKLNILKCYWYILGEIKYTLILEITGDFVLQQVVQPFN